FLSSFFCYGRMLMMMTSLNWRNAVGQGCFSESWCSNDQRNLSIISKNPKLSSREDVSSSASALIVMLILPSTSSTLPLIMSSTFFRFSLALVVVGSMARNASEERRDGILLSLIKQLSRKCEEP